LSKNNFTFEFAFSYVSATKMNTKKPRGNSRRDHLVNCGIDQTAYEIMLEVGWEHDIKHIVMRFAAEIEGAF
jgi:hypothetical protein